MLRQESRVPKETNTDYREWKSYVQGSSRNGRTWSSSENHEGLLQLASTFHIGTMAFPEAWGH